MRVHENPGCSSSVVEVVWTRNAWPPDTACHVTAVLAGWGELGLEPAHEAPVFWWLHFQEFRELVARNIALTKNENIKAYNNYICEGKTHHFLIILHFTIT